MANSASLLLASLLASLPPEWHHDIDRLFRLAYADGYANGQQDLTDQEEDIDDLYRM